jgi:hypothetical protein
MRRRAVLSSLGSPPLEVSGVVALRGHPASCPALLPAPLPHPIASEPDVSNSLPLYVDGLDPECRQTAQKEACIKRPAVDATTQRLGRYVQALLRQQLSQLRVVEAPLSHSVRQELTGELLPGVMFRFCRHRSIFKNFLWSGSWRNRAFLLGLFVSRGCRIIPGRVTKMSPYSKAALYFLPPAFCGGEVRSRSHDVHDEWALEGTRYETKQLD